MGATTVISGPGIPLEVLRTFTPLGIQFWDLTQNVTVSSDLLVCLRLLKSSAPPLQATLTTSGVYAFFGLPGLRAAEYPDGSGQFGPNRSFTYVVTVRDTLGRYLPEVLMYRLDQTGAVLVNGLPDASRGPRLAYLFSAPTRPPLPGIAAVRADLVDSDANAPAAWAVIRVQVAGQTEVWTGIADDQGRATVFVPYPPVDRLRLGSPPGSGQGNITGQSWDLTVNVWYSPASLTLPLANQAGVVWPFTITPNLKGILDQKPATIWLDSNTPVNNIATSLTLEQGLVLRSTQTSPPGNLSVLNITRGTSPP